MDILENLNLKFARKYAELRNFTRNFGSRVRLFEKQYSSYDKFSINFNLPDKIKCLETIGGVVNSAIPQNPHISIVFFISFVTNE